MTALSLLSAIHQSHCMGIAVAVWFIAHIISKRSQSRMKTVLKATVLGDYSALPFKMSRCWLEGVCTSVIAIAMLPLEGM